MGDRLAFPVGWKQLYQIALRETDPAMIPRRIEKARNAVLDRIEDLLTRPSCVEHQELNSAFRCLRELESNLVVDLSVKELACVQKSSLRATRKRQAAIVIDARV